MCYTYDSLGRVTERVIKNLNDDTVLSTEMFSYDAVGNLIKLTTTIKSSSSLRGGCFSFRSSIVFVVRYNGYHQQGKEGLHERGN